MNLKPDMNFLFSFRPGSRGFSKEYIDQEEAGLKRNLTLVILGRFTALCSVAGSPGFEIRPSLLYWPVLLLAKGGKLSVNAVAGPQRRAGCIKNLAASGHKES